MGKLEVGSGFEAGSESGRISFYLEEKLKVRSEFQFCVTLQVQVMTDFTVATFKQFRFELEHRKYLFLVYSQPLV